MWWWWQTLMTKAPWVITCVWCQNKLGMICNLTTSIPCWLSHLYPRWTASLWNRVTKWKMVIVGWKLVSQKPGFLLQWHCAVWQFATVVQHNKKNDEPQVPSAGPTQPLVSHQVTLSFFQATWASGDFDLTFRAVSVPSSVGFSNMWLDVMSTTTVPNLTELPQ